MRDYSEANDKLQDALHIDLDHQRFNVAYSRYTHDPRCQASFQYVVNMLTGALQNDTADGALDMLPPPKAVAKYACELAQAMHDEHKARGWHHPVLVEPLKEEKRSFGFGGRDDETKDQLRASGD